MLDEKVVLGAAVLFWTYARLGRRNDIARGGRIDGSYSRNLAGAIAHLLLERAGFGLSRVIATAQEYTILEAVPH